MNNNQMYTLSSIDKIKAVAKFNLNDTALRSNLDGNFKYTYMLACKILAGEMSKKDTLLFLDKNGEAIKILNKEFVFKIFNNTLNKIITDKHDEFGIHILNLNRNETLEFTDFLNKIDSIIVLK